MKDLGANYLDKLSLSSLFLALILWLVLIKLLESKAKLINQRIFFSNLRRLAFQEQNIADMLTQQLNHLFVSVYLLVTNFFYPQSVHQNIKGPQ